VPSLIDFLSSALSGGEAIAADLMKKRRVATGYRAESSVWPRRGIADIWAGKGAGEYESPVRYVTIVFPVRGALLCVVSLDTSKGLGAAIVDTVLCESGGIILTA